MVANAMAQGRTEEKSDIARRMLMHGDNEDYIQLITGLTADEIGRLVLS